jgi:hypothetical protein
MGLRPTQGDEKRLRSRNHFPWNRRPFLCHPEQPTRGLRLGREMTKHVPSALSKGEVEGCPRSRF